MTYSADINCLEQKRSHEESGREITHRERSFRWDLPDIFFVNMDASRVSIGRFTV